MLTGSPVVLGAISSTGLILIGMLIGACVIVYTIHSVRKVLEKSARERTKRELAAYVAEGTVSADDATKILASDSDEAECMIADGVAWGTVKPEKAEKLIRAIRDRRSGEAVTAREAPAR